MGAEGPPEHEPWARGRARLGWHLAQGHPARKGRAIWLQILLCCVSLVGSHHLLCLSCPLWGNSWSCQPRTCVQGRRLVSWSPAPQLHPLQAEISPKDAGSGWAPTARGPLQGPPVKAADTRTASEWPARRLERTGKPVAHALPNTPGPHGRLRPGSKPSRWGASALPRGFLCPWEHEARPGHASRSPSARGRNTKGQAAIPGRGCRRPAGSGFFRKSCPFHLAGPPVHRGHSSPPRCPSFTPFRRGIPCSCGQDGQNLELSGNLTADVLTKAKHLLVPSEFTLGRDPRHRPNSRVQHGYF